MSSIHPGISGVVALISGGASGIGAATARLFAARGARVLIGDLLEKGGESLADEIGATFIRLDVTSQADWTVAASHTPTILVNNAGRLCTGGIEDCTSDDMRATLEVNLIGALNGIRAVVPGMRETGGGTIVNVGSAASTLGYAGLAAYVASKHALLGLTKAASLDLVGDSIRVNIVLPGQIRTPMTARWSNTPRLTPMGRAGDADEVARLIAFLASSEASYCTGGAFSADGGLTAGLAGGLPRDR